MNDCITCGRKVRLRTVRTSFNRKQGVSHWLEVDDSGYQPCPCLKDFYWTKWKADKTRPTITEKKIAEWNTQNSPALSRPHRGTEA